MTPAEKHAPQAVIFDLDGTVLDTLPSVYRCFGEALEPYLGKRPSNKEIRDRFGPADHHIVAQWAGPEHAEEAVERLYRAYESALDTMGVFPGMIPLLQALREAGRRVGLVTGRGRPSTDWLLQKKGLALLFDASVGGDEVTRPKPAPEGLHRVLAMLGVPAGRAVYVGDSILDFHAASEAGVPFIGVTWGTEETGALEKAGARLVHAVDDLRGVLLARD